MSSSTLHPPADAPPSYESATGSTTPARISTDSPAARRERNGIPPEHRRSMEDENRPLPPGWVRQFDAKEGHQFFVDTKADPPRSTWLHPYDDPDYLATLSPEEKKKYSRLHRTMTMDDIAAESSDDESHPKLPPRGKSAVGAGAGAAAAAASSSSSAAEQPKGIHKFGRKLKDSLTGSTHEEREAQRRRREEEERKAYAMHLRARQAMVRAMETGQPQFLLKDQQGRDVYIEPPYGPGQGPHGYNNGAYGYNPYAQGPYADRNARFVRPAGPYNRPYGYGYGGGLGAPVAAGFLGGALLGGLLF